VGGGGGGGGPGGGAGRGGGGGGSCGGGGGGGGGGGVGGGGWGEKEESYLFSAYLTSKEGSKFKGDSDSVSPGNQTKRKRLGEIKKGEKENFARVKRRAD